MLNVGGAEFLVILLVALIVFGPTKLPEVAKQVGTMARELRRISNSFQAELKSALDDPIEEAARDRGNEIVAAEQAASPEPAQPETPDHEPEVSTAEAAGMYNVADPSDDQPDQATESGETSEEEDAAQEEPGDGGDTP